MEQWLLKLTCGEFRNLDVDIRSGLNQFIDPMASSNWDKIYEEHHVFVLDRTAILNMLGIVRMARQAARIILDDVARSALQDTFPYAAMNTLQDLARDGNRAEMFRKLYEYFREHGECINEGR